jgi:hypothetical protein
MSGATLHLIGGGAVLVDQTPNDAARLLWGRDSGDDAHDMGFASLQYDAKPILVNPRAVAYIEPAAD